MQGLWEEDQITPQPVLFKIYQRGHHDTNKDRLAKDTFLHEKCIFLNKDSFLWKSIYSKIGIFCKFMRKNLQASLKLFCPLIAVGVPDVMQRFSSLVRFRRCVLLGGCCYWLICSLVFASGLLEYLPRLLLFGAVSLDGRRVAGDF